MPKPYKCKNCLKELTAVDTFKLDCLHFCEECYMKRKLNANKSTLEEVSHFNEPEHYHKHDMDTITFLQEGFRPEVFTGFAIGSIIKYLQRYEYKNGKDDILKAKDYMFRLYEFVIEKDLLK